ncbi:MAG TPA: glutamate synthase subunit beta, partial [Candidatus Altiarchaeales archaeon]|nr:glutamate synthase subunit beta [Candidatus Altiarchaeales archaeon]
MGHPRGFLEKKRRGARYRRVCERVKDYKPVLQARPESISIEQASRCMDCGVPFCHHGCPIGNTIPEWNDLIFRKQWGEAFEILESTNNLPEITGRLCPALCEYACVVGIHGDPVTIRENELAVIEHAFKQGLVKPRITSEKSGKKVAVVGSGPAGLSCAQQLARAGHEVVVFEKDSKPGGILRYGIPDFKLDKKIIERRIRLMEAEGVTFKTGVNAGVDVSAKELQKQFDAIVLCTGSRKPRDLNVPGRELDGIHFAMDYFAQQNRRVSGEKIDVAEITAKDKNVVVVGGGDTGSDCVGTAHRQGAKCVTQVEILEKPSACRPDEHPWPTYPRILQTSSSHEEGGERLWKILTKEFLGGGKVEKIRAVNVEFGPEKDGCGRPVMK